MREGERSGEYLGGDKILARTLRNTPLSDLTTGVTRACEVRDTGSRATVGTADAEQASERRQPEGAKGAETWGQLWSCYLKTLVGQVWVVLQAIKE